MLGGGAGTTRDCFELIHQAEKYGARVALFGRKINLAESPLDIVRFMRAVADDALTPSDAVAAYHDVLRKADIAPHRELAADNEITEARAEAGLRGRRHDRAKRRPHGGNLVRRPQQVDPRVGLPEDTMTTIVDLDRQGGGSACNMAIDLKRLDPDMHVETMGLVGDDGDGRFLVDQCEKFAIAHAGLMLRPGGVTPFSDCFNSRESGRRTHFFHPGVAAALTPDDFDFARQPAPASCISACPARTRSWMRLGASTATGWAATLKAARAAGLQTNLEMVSTDAREGARLRALLRAASRSPDRQRLRDRLRRRTSRRAMARARSRARRSKRRCASR